MKNLMIYVNPNKSFSNGNWQDETDVLAKVQIDNSLAMGWKKEDMMLVTNFPYEYSGIKAIEVGDTNYCSFSDGTPSKINAICELFDRGLIEDDLYWFHDFDAFQLEDLEMEIPDNMIALTRYGVCDPKKGLNGRWSTGSLFFGKDTKDIFQWIKEAVYKYQANEEVSLLALTRHNRHGISDRIRELNISYNFATRRRNIIVGYEIAEKPLKVIHFHPYDKRDVYYLHNGKNNVEVCLHGKNPMNMPLVNERLIGIFNRHGIN